MTVKLPGIEEMLKAGVHFGHQKSRWYPKMKPFIFGARNGVHIINLEETTRILGEVLAFIEEQVSNGKTFLFVGTKKQAQELTKKHALDCGMPYINERWLGGTITNFSNISKLTRKLVSLKEKKEKGELKKYTKKEQLDFSREIEKLEKFVGGIQNLKKLPDFLFVVDIKNEATAVKEAIKKHIPIIAVCDTNTNPNFVDYPIPANDDSIKSIEMILGLASEAVKAGAKKQKPEEIKKAEKK